MMSTLLGVGGSPKCGRSKGVCVNNSTKCKQGEKGVQKSKNVVDINQVCPALRVQWISDIWSTLETTEKLTM